jgi:transcriptional regulator with XRE-family HTH domain
MTLAELASQAGLTTSYVSQVERGVANPTLSSLMTLSKAVGLEMGSLYSPSTQAELIIHANHRAPGEEEAGKVSVLRHGQRRRVVYPGTHIANELLSPNLRKKMEVIWIDAPAGSSSGGHPDTHSGEECGVVISGLMQFWVGDQDWLLEPRDAIYFPSTLPHRWTSVGDADLAAIWIITPPTF